QPGPGCTEHGLDVFFSTRQILKRGTSSMPVQAVHHAWVTCPCNKDPNSHQATSQAALSLVVELSTSIVRVALSREPRAGMLLSVEFLQTAQTYSPPVIARIVAVKPRPQGGWLAHCNWIRALTAKEREERFNCTS